MARTEEAAALSERHRLVQLGIRAQALRDFSRLWPLWTPTDSRSFADLVTATTTLVRAYHPISAGVAASYFTAFRSAESVDGAAMPVLAATPADAMVAASLYATGETATRKAIDAGRPSSDAMQAAFVRTSGAVSRHILDGGRNTILQSVERDEQALGWARVTDGDPCYFCLTLAARGPVYKSEQSADFQAHDHCGCAAEAFYRGSAWPGRAREFRDTYEAAQQYGLDEGLLQPGENSSAARLNAVRRYIAAR
jgi:hypothetical protein